MHLAGPCLPEKRDSGGLFLILFLLDGSRFGYSYC
uniref:Uncharacterized protein n=1 Tax=Siphoviridae sp. ctAUQ2 TaxID=2826182 RepID=A0A8S5MYT1_9CAUD|nr:MAG TPA: hypothetical protein [Siphoviridae sp. ctAUQ2]